MLAWKLYVEDNKEVLPNAKQGPYEWCGGWLDFDPANRENWDDSVNLRTSIIWPYCGKSAAIFKCPADKSRVTVNGKQMPRVRSLSMLNWVGGRGLGLEMGWSGPGWRVYHRTSDMTDPGPANTFVFLDEREDSINDGMFVVDMTGYPDKPSTFRIVDIPASYHGGAGGFSFADGHSELKRWRDGRTFKSFAEGVVTPYDNASPNNADIAWMQQRATRRMY